MIFKRVIALSFVLLVAIVIHPGRAFASASVQPLFLPAGATIKPEGTEVQMASRGDVTAATILLGPREIPRVVVWRNSNVEVLHVEARFDQGMGSDQTLGALATDGTIYVNGGYRFSGAYSGTRYHVLAYQRNGEKEMYFSGCAVAGDVGDPIVEAANGDELAITFQSPDLINFDSVDSGIYAPNAAIT
ncbi:MAG: hypothetical protein M3Z37_03330, partial [Candidatus Eremiobacteraeota bacterium]|nr:hypothetical protein [Candidatus Eremiobacteraeota bacterium]